jgi:OOP family OmpA-OmpF porin
MMFGFDNADLRPEAIPALDEAARVMNMHPDLKVEIQGHTDNVGSPEYNQKLSERRAKAVQDYLIGAGIDSNRLEAVGYGETKPIHSNDTSGGRDRNRRVSFEVIE